MPESPTSDIETTKSSEDSENPGSAEILDAIAQINASLDRIEAPMNRIEASIGSIEETIQGIRDEAQDAMAAREKAMRMKGANNTSSNGGLRPVRYIGSGQYEWGIGIGLGEAG
jgi:chromosome segregation ATPase